MRSGEKKVSSQKRRKKSDNENYGKIIKDLRIECGLTQNDIAKALGVTTGYVSNVENNRSAMSLKVLIYFAKLTGRTLDDIVGCLETSYTQDSLDKKIARLTSSMSPDEKKRLIKIIELIK
ncbi:MAG: helix-turn-helix domain-containing protein [Lachnospiraceae bacterium]|nr:helix-turn-helix domain-containing protein [Lachnospiraceae bacterium]